MFSFAWITNATGSQRGSVLALIGFFIIGLIILMINVFKKANPSTGHQHS